MPQQEASPALILARGELAHAEQHIDAAHLVLEGPEQADPAARHQAAAELAYYGQVACRYRTQIARLLREETP